MLAGFRRLFPSDISPHGSFSGRVLPRRVRSEFRKEVCGLLTACPTPVRIYVGF